MFWLQNSVAFISAPYGFGPSSKAVAISSYLPQSVQRVFWGYGPTLEMARRSHVFSSCVELDFGAGPECVARRLAPFDVLIFINTTRFISASAVGSRPTVLVETLAWLRDVPPPCSPLLSAYFAQRFFHQPFTPELVSLSNFIPIGAILPLNISAGPHFGRNLAPSRRSPIVHCGGLFSPAMVRGAEQDFVRQTLKLVSGLNEPIRAIVPAYLHNCFRTDVTDQISLLDCSPLSVHEQIIGSEFCLTTTGIEFTYEAAALGVPTLFLPPFNASQQFQLAYHRKTSVECIPFKTDTKVPLAGIAALQESTITLQEIGIRGLWSAQFAEIECFLDRLRTHERGALLQQALDVQRKEIEGIALNGAQTIALHIMERLSRELTLQ